MPTGNSIPKQLLVQCPSSICSNIRVKVLRLQALPQINFHHLTARNDAAQVMLLKLQELEDLEKLFKSSGNTTNAVGRPLPARPWEQSYSPRNYGGYNSTLNYDSGYGSGTYGSSYGGVGGLHGGGMYGISMYRGGYGGLYGSGMYGGGAYNGGFGGAMGGYRMGMGGPNGVQDFFLDARKPYSQKTYIIGPGE